MVAHGALEKTRSKAADFLEKGKIIHNGKHTAEPYRQVQMDPKFSMKARQLKKGALSNDVQIFVITRWFPPGKC